MERFVVLIICVLFCLTAKTQQQSGAPSIDDLEKQIGAKRASNTAAAQQRAAKQAAAIMQENANRYRGSWKGEWEDRDNMFANCYAMMHRSFEFDFQTFDASTNTLSGRLTDNWRVTYEYDPDSKVHNPTDAYYEHRAKCATKSPYSNTTSASIYLHIRANSTGQSITFIDEGCYGDKCGALSRGSYDWTFLDNGQAEFTSRNKRVRLSRN
jgi:hypothetical protein